MEAYFVFFSTDAQNWDLLRCAGAFLRVQYTEFTISKLLDFYLINQLQSPSALRQQLLI
jgi:hypothetical protein